jgi:mono/diheme cytochrome c family protein
MHTGFFHTHKLVVLLFLIHYVVKLVLLLSNQENRLTRYTAITRIPEMIISALFLLTGTFLLVQLPQITTYTWVKIAFVFTSIPLAVIGFRKKNKMLAILSVVLILAAYGLAEVNKKHKADVKVDLSNTETSLVGKTIYDSSCASCHGADGKLGLGGAKDLTASTLSRDEKRNIIVKGKNAMAGYERSLTAEQIDAVLEYVEQFSKP